MTNIVAAIFAHQLTTSNVALPQAATSLAHRPLLHSTLLLLVLVAVLWLVAGQRPRNKACRLAPFIVLQALLSHHLRDAWRRGLWLWPINASISVSYSVYLIGVVLVLPLVTGWVSGCPPDDFRLL